MTRQRAIIKIVNVFIAITFLSSNVVLGDSLSTYKLAVPTQIDRVSDVLGELGLSGVVLKTIFQHGVGGNLSLHREWGGRDGVSGDIRRILAREGEGFKVFFSDTSVYIIRGAFIHRYSIDNQTEDPFYISCLKQYEDNDKVKILDDDVVLDGKNRRLKVFLIAPEINAFVRDISQFMVGDLADVIQYQNLVIVINSQHGAGKGVMAKYVAKKTGLPVFSAGDMKRRMAQARGMSIEVFNEFLGKNPDERKRVNDEIDQAQLEAIRKGGVIIDSSFGAYLVEREREELAGKGLRIFKIFVKADLDVRARRVLEAKRYGDAVADLDGARRNLLERDSYDQRQFRELTSGEYDIFDESNYDIVFDNTDTTLDDIAGFADRVVDGIKYPGKVKRVYGSRRPLDIDIRFNVLKGEFIYKGDARLDKDEEDNLWRAVGNWLVTIPPVDQPIEIDILVTENIDGIAQHRPNVIELHRAVLRVPPGVGETETEQYRLFADGVVWHEGYHFLNPTFTEEQARQATLEYLANRRDILMATIYILSPESDNSFYTVDDWLSVLQDRMRDIASGYKASGRDEGEDIERLRQAFIDGRLSTTISFSWTRLVLSTRLKDEPQDSPIIRALNEVLNIPVVSKERTLERIDEIYRRYTADVGTLFRVEFFKRFYFALHPDFANSYETLRKVHGDEVKAQESILDESNKTGFSVITTVCGSLNEDYNMLAVEPMVSGVSRRGPPKEIRPKFVYVGGGGQGATIIARCFASWIRELPYRQKRNITDPIIVNVFATSDDGGSSGIMAIEMRRSDEWNVYYFSPGDASSILGRGTDDDVKSDLYIYEEFGRFNSSVNINTATMEELVTVVDKVIAERIIVERISRGRFASVDEIRDIVGSKYEDVKKQFKLDGPTVATTEALLIEQFRRYEEKVARGGRFKEDRYIRRLPPDWNFFIANNLELARLIDREFIKTGLIKLSEASWKNLAIIGYLVKNNMIYKAQNGQPAGINNLDDFAKLYEALGIYGSQMYPSTDNEAYQAVVLEAGLLGVNRESYVMRRDGDRLRYKKATTVREEFSDIIERARELGMVTGSYNEGMFNNMLDKEFTTDLDGGSELASGSTMQIGGVNFKYEVVEEGMVIYLNDNPCFIMSEDPNEEGKTRIRPVERVDIKVVSFERGDKDKEEDPNKTYGRIKGTLAQDTWTDLPTDTGPMYLKVEGNIITLKSRLVEGQTFITDEILHSRAEKFRYKKPVLTPDNKFDIKGVDLRGNPARQFRSASSEERPVANKKAIEAIRNATHGVISGESSFITSVLAGTVIDGIPQALRDKEGIPKIFVWKISTDLETAGLSLKEQILLMEEAVQEITGEVIRFEDMFTHIVVADVPGKYREEFQEKRAGKFVKIGDKVTAQKITQGSEKLSKFLPTKIYDVKEEDLEFLRARGVTPIRTSYVIMHEGKVVYDKDKLTRFLDSLASEYIAKIEEGDTASHRQEVFYPMNKLHEQFTEMVNKSDNPGEVNIFIDRGRNGVERFSLRIPSLENLRNDRILMDFMAWYVAMYIYNRLHTLGGQRIVIDAEEDIFNAIRDEFNKRFNPEGRLNVNEFIERVYGKGLEIVRGVEREIVSKKGGETTLYSVEPIRSGRSLGIGISGEHIKIAVLEGNELIAHQIIPWNPSRFNSVDEFLSELITRITTVIRDFSDIAAIGISWRGVVLDGEIKTVLNIVPHIQPSELDNLGENLRHRLGITDTVPVAIINDGNAVGITRQAEYTKTYGEPLRKALCINVLRGVAGAYIDANGGVVEDLLGEFGNIILDLPYEAEQHALTGVSGVLQRYLVRKKVIKLAEEVLDLGSGTDIEKDRRLRELVARGDENAVRACVKIYKRLARYWAGAIAEMYNVLDIEKVILTGTPFYGRAGRVAVEEIEKYLKRFSPGIKDLEIILAEEEDIDRARVEAARGAALFANSAKFWRASGEIKKDWFETMDFKPSYIIDGIFEKLEQFGNEFTQEVKIAFDRGPFGTKVFSIRIPRLELLDMDRVLAEVIEEAVVRYVYNRLGTIGARKVYVDSDYVYNILKDRFEFDGTRITIDDLKKSKDKKRPYWMMTEYLNMVYERPGYPDTAGTLFERVDTALIDTMPQEVALPRLQFDKNKGHVIGLDIGGSDIKVVVFKDGQITYYEELKEGWSPKEFTKAEQHLEVILGLLDRARDKGGVDRIDAIGVSINLALNGEHITGKGPVVRGLKGNEVRRFQDLANVIRGRYTGTVVSVINDGDAGALWGSIDMEMRNVVFLAFGTGLAAGYVDSNGSVTGILGEMGNVSIDLGIVASMHDFTNMPGGAQVYLSQRAIIDPGRLAQKKGIVLLGESEAERLEDIQKKLEEGTEEEKQKIREIFSELGLYLATFIAEVYNYLPMENVLIAGRVTKGEGGNILKTRAEALLRELLPGKVINIRFPEAPAGVTFPVQPSDARKSQGEIYKGISQAIGAAYYAMQRLQNPTASAPVAHPISKQAEGRPEVKLFEVTITDEHKVVTNPVAIIDPQSEAKVKLYNQEMLTEALDKLVKYYGMGVWQFIKEIEVVDNLQGLRLEQQVPLAETVDTKVRIDIDSFRSEALLFDVLEHEFLHNVLGLLNIDKGIDEVTATYMDVKRFLSGDEEYRKGILDVLKAGDNGLDPSGDYVRLLERLLELETRGELLTDAIIISSVVRYLLTTDRYSDLRETLGINNEDAWQKAVLATQQRLEAVLKVYDDLIGAKNGIQVSGEIVSKVREAEGLAIKVIKTFRGIRIDGLSRLDKKLAGIIAAAVKVASKTDEIASLPLAMTEGQYYIVVDKDRVTEEMKEAIGRLEKNNVFKVVYEVPSDYEPKKIIYLIDPADLKEDMQKGILYLPMPYLRSSLYMAAAIVSAGGEVDNINPLVTELISDLYSQLLGRQITKKDLQDLFTAPWIILPEIRGIIGEINNLRKALTQIEKAA